MSLSGTWLFQGEWMRMKPRARVQQRIHTGLKSSPAIFLWSVWNGNWAHSQLFSCLAFPRSFTPDHSWTLPYPILLFPHYSFVLTATSVNPQRTYRTVKNHTNVLLPCFLPTQDLLPCPSHSPSAAGRAMRGRHVWFWRHTRPVRYPAWLLRVWLQ